jgi:hypothetical protein
MAFFGAYFDWDELYLGLFQGDDSAILGRNVRQVVDLPFLKVDSTPLPTFCGFLVNRGLVIDVVAMSVKLANRTFKTQQSLDDYRMGVADWLNTAAGHEAWSRAITLGAHKHGLSFHDVELLYEFLAAFAAGRVVSRISSPLLAKHVVHPVVVQK